MAWIEHDHADVGALVAHVSASFESACREAIRTRGQAWLALAGGRTPLPVYAHLAQAGLDGVVSAIPTDERCVPHDHPACNLRNLRDGFAADPNIVVNALTSEDGDEAASLATTRSLLALNPQPFDAVSTLPDPLPPEAPFARISLTLPRLLHARALHLVVTGQDKRRVLREAQARDNDQQHPVASLLHAHGHTVHIHWSP